MRFLPIVLAAVATSIASTSAAPSEPASSQPQQFQARAVSRDNDGNAMYHSRGSHSLSSLFALNRRSSGTVKASLPKRPERKQKTNSSYLQKAEAAKLSDGNSSIVIEGTGSFLVNSTTNSTALARSVDDSQADSVAPEDDIVLTKIMQHRRAASCTKKTTTTTKTVTQTSTKKSSTTKAATSTKKTSTTTKTTTKTSTKTSTTKSSTTKAATSTKKTTTTTKTTKTSTAVTSVAASTGTMIMGGYWPSWADLTPEDIDWDLFDLMAFAFATATTTGGVSIDTSDAALLKRLVTAGHNGGAKIIVSIGGWDNSQGFSPSVSTAALRSTFATSIKNFLNTYDLDGVDIDWEYPNSAYATNYASDDAANFQTFLQTLRSTLGKDAIITAAVSDDTWTSSSGGTVSNVSRAAGALSYIMIMNYDVWGESSTPGPNAPLANLCGNSTQPDASAAAAIKQWSAAGMPAKKMLLGVPYYGYVQDSSDTQLIQRSFDDGEKEQNMRKRRLNRSLGGKPRWNDHPARRSFSSSSDEKHEKRTTKLATGQMNFNLFVQNKALKRGTGTNTGEYVAVSPWKKYWDDCSDTPYLANGVQVITYDDTTSLYDKAQLARTSGLGGTSMWSVDGDTIYWNLTRAMRSGMEI